MNNKRRVDGNEHYYLRAVSHALCAYIECLPEAHIEYRDALYIEGREASYLELA